MASVEQARATVDDLYREEGKAELIGGRIVRYMATDFEAHQVACNIYVSLRAFQKTVGGGWACNDGLAFVVPEMASGRETFSPDAAYFVGPPPAQRRKFVPGAPTFAVEVRSEGDYGRPAERAMAAKRADYFEAGSLAVWDVDPDARAIRLYLGPGEPARIFGPGDLADAGPALPGWAVAVDEIFG